MLRGWRTVGTMDWDRHKRAQGQFWLRERPPRWTWWFAVPLAVLVIGTLGVQFVNLESPPAWTDQLMPPLAIALMALVFIQWVQMYIRAYRATAPSDAPSEESSPAT